jgi:hypothetical protein
VNTDASWPDAEEARSRVLGIQTKLHQWATDAPNRRFDDLYNLVCDPAVLTEAWRRVRGNKGSRSAGVDGQTAYYVETERGVEPFLGDLRADLKARRFQPLPVRERMIPKASGKLRRLGIPTVRDRVVQAAIKLVLEPIFEADFEPCSYGFRPRRRAQDAIAEIHHFCSRSYEWVLEGDITACFDAPSHCPLRCWCFVEEGWTRPIHLDSQAFSAARAHVDGLELAALYTLQHRLARHAESKGCLQHGHEPRRCLVDEPVAKLLRHADAPRRSRCELFAGDEAVTEPAMHGGWGNAENFGRLDDRDQVSLGLLRRWLIASDPPVMSQALDDGGGEAKSRGTAPALAVQHTGNGGIGVVQGETTDELDGVLVGSDGWLVRATKLHDELGAGTSSPTQQKLRSSFLFVDIDAHFLEEGAHELFSVAVGRGGRRPDLLDVTAELEKRRPLGFGERTGLGRLFAGELRFCLGERGELGFPLGLESSRHEPILRIDCHVASLGAHCLIACALDLAPPLTSAASWSASRTSAALSAAWRPAGAKVA